MRFKIVRIIIFLFLLLIAADLFYAQIIKGSYYFNLSMRNRIRVVPLEGVRGRILDRQGIVLADNQLSFDVAVVPQDVEDDDQLFRYLGKVLNTAPEELRKRFKRRFLTPFAPVPIADDVARDVAIEIEENKFRFPGLMIEESYSRVYPQGSIGAHVLGYVGKISRAKMEQLKDYGYTMQSIIGYSGVEEFYDDVLRGESGGRQIEINNRGQEVTLLGLKNPSVGKDITLSVDSRIQEISDELLQSRRGAVIVMDLANGEILSMVSSPSYDPNDFADRSADINKYFHDTMSPLLNRAVNSRFPPGSVFKIPVAVAALETDHISRNTTFICPGYYMLGQARFGCAHVHNEQNLIQALAHSCNVYFFHTGLLVGSDEVRRFAKLLGLTGKTNIDLPFEAEGSVPSKSSRRKGQWFTGDTLNFSIGQGGVTSTPIELVKMMSVVANRGVVVQPHFIRSVGDRPVDKYASGGAGQIALRKSTYNVVEEGLADVVDESTGTANVLNIQGLKTFGKTGTAQAGRGRDDHSWFVGYTKSNNKNIVYCVFLENGGSSHNAVLLARELLLRMQGMGII